MEELESSKTSPVSQTNNFWYLYSFYKFTKSPLDLLISKYTYNKHKKTRTTHFSFINITHNFQLQTHNRLEKKYDRSILKWVLVILFCRQDISLLETIPILRQHIFGLFMTHPPTLPQVKLYWTLAKITNFLTPPTKSLCWRIIGMVP